jgi:hypothetical protein
MQGVHAGETIETKTKSSIKQHTPNTAGSLIHIVLVSLRAHRKKSLTVCTNLGHTRKVRSWGGCKMGLYPASRGSGEKEEERGRLETRRSHRALTIAVLLLCLLLCRPESPPLYPFTRGLEGLHDLLLGRARLGLYSAHMQPIHTSDSVCLRPTKETASSVDVPCGCTPSGPSQGGT